MSASNRNQPCSCGSGAKAKKCCDTAEKRNAAKLAYEGMPGRPQGMLVFEVELLDFK